MLSILDPRLTWGEAETAAAVAAGVVVAKADGAPLSPYDLKRLQVGGRSGCACWVLAWVHGGCCTGLAPPVELAPVDLPPSTPVLKNRDVLPCPSPPPQTVPQAYSNSLVDHHLILDLITPLAHAYFCGRLPAPLSYSQAAILTCVGLQQHEIGRVSGEGCGCGGCCGCWPAVAVLHCAGRLLRCWRLAEQRC